jgi:ATP-dependent protease ClpP protease subunit
MAKTKESRNFAIDHKINLKVDDLTFQLHNYDLDLKSNHIYLFGVDRGYDSVGSDQEPGIEHVIASRFIRNFNLCMRVNPEKPILIHMKSNGGYWEEGMSIYDTIRSSPWPVTILNYTHARSMTSIIFQAANKRVMMPHSHFMFHDGTYSVEGTVKQVRSVVQFDKRCDAEMIDIYIKSMKRQGEFKNKTEQQIKTWLRGQMDKKEDVYLTSPETVKYGLADEIFDYNWKNLTEYTDEQMER